MRAFGMPGPGGSLGECALCAKPFLQEILLAKAVKSFTVDGCDSEMFAHDGCIKAFAGKDYIDLPPESALRKAYERAIKRENHHGS